MLIGLFAITNQVQRRVVARGNNLTAEEQSADEIFRNTYIPRTLGEFSLEEAIEDVIKVDLGKDEQVRTFFVPFLFFSSSNLDSHLPLRFITELSLV